MQTLYAIFGTLVGVLAVVARVFFYRAGRNKERLKSQEKTLDDIEKANNAIVRAKSDKSLAQRLRDRYGIK